MRASKAQVDIEIQQRVTGRDPEYNEIVITWSTFIECAAEMTEGKGGERFVDNQRVYEAPSTFRCRAEDADGITPDMRIIFEGTIYNIVSISKDRAARRYIDIVTLAGTGVS